MVAFWFLSTVISFLFVWGQLGQVRRRKNPGIKASELPGVTTVWDLVRYNVPKYWGMPNYRALGIGLDLFGAVFQFKIGSNLTIAVMDMPLAKKIMSSSAWMNRLPEGHVIYERSFKKPLGLLFGNGRDWTACREFASKTLCKLGFGRGTSMEYCIAREVEDTLCKLEEVVGEDEGGQNNKSFQPHGFFHVPTLNILWQLIAGSRFSHDDPKLRELLKYFYDWNRSFNLGATPLHAFPWLRHIPGVTEHDAWVTGHQKFASFFKSIAEERLEKETYKDNPEDFIDHFLREMSKRKDDPKNFLFTEEQLLTLCTDLFMAGADTTSNTLEYALLFMALHPRVQDKVQEEIDSVIGSGSFPSLVMKNRMPYVEATTSEILRHACAIPVTGRCPLEDMEINGCRVAKGSIIGINIHAMHFSSQLWSDPQAFRPERFISDSGRIINQHKIIPFGYGKRKCLGESTSRNTFFLFFTGMLQKFTFSLPSDRPPPSLEDVCGLSRAPKPYFVAVKRRLVDT